MGEKELSLYEYYTNMFDNLPADTPELRQECFHLRYHVYCLENPFEPINPKEIETDEYDDQACHFLLRHKPTNLYVGTTRIIRAHKHQEGDGYKVPPVFRLCQEHGITLPPEYTPESSFEVSRFAISKTFRRRTEDAQYPASYNLEELMLDRARIIPCMTLGLIASIYQMSVREDSKYCCVVMAQALARLLAKLGILFHPAGEPIEYHGTRQIFTISRAEFSESVSHLRPEIMDIFTSGGQYKCVG